MTINVQILDNSARISISGRFDFDLHRDFNNAYSPLLDNATVNEIEVELSKVDYLDSAALGMLMLLNERAKDAGKSILLINASGVVSKIFEVANFNRMFKIKNVP